MFQYSQWSNDNTDTNSMQLTFEVMNSRYKTHKLKGIFLITRNTFKSKQCISITVLYSMKENTSNAQHTRNSLTALFATHTLYVFTVRTLGGIYG